MDTNWIPEGELSCEKELDPQQTTSRVSACNPQLWALPSARAVKKIVEFDAVVEAWPKELSPQQLNLPSSFPSPHMWRLPALINWYCICAAASTECVMLKPSLLSPQHVIFQFKSNPQVKFAPAVRETNGFASGGDEAPCCPPACLLLLDLQQSTKPVVAWIAQTCNSPTTICVYWFRDRRVGFNEEILLLLLLLGRGQQKGWRVDSLSPQKKSLPPAKPENATAVKLRAVNCREVLLL
jgi:hypothetical protein